MSSASHEANQLREKQMEWQNKLRPGMMTSGDAGKNNYPVEFYGPHAVEQKFDTWKEASAIAQQAGLGQPNFQNEIYDFAETRKRQANLLSFERFVETCYDTTDINQLKVMNEVYPEWQQKREEAIIAQYDMGKNVELMKLRGIRSKDDLILAFGVANGEIKVPTLNWADVPVTNDADQATRGFLNPRRWWGESDKENIKKITKTGRGWDHTDNRSDSAFKAIASKGMLQNLMTGGGKLPATTKPGAT